MTAVGRLLRTLRSARAMTVEAASAGADMPPARLRGLERGDGVLEYLEGIRLAKSLDLCPNCFRRLLEAAAERDADGPDTPALGARPAVSKGAPGHAP